MVRLVSIVQMNGLITESTEAMHGNIQKNAFGDSKEKRGTYREAAMKQHDPGSDEVINGYQE
jgi:hypothetical protein